MSRDENSGQAEPAPKLQVAVILPYPVLSKKAARIIARLESTNHIATLLIGLEARSGASAHPADPFQIWRQLDARVFGGGDFLGNVPTGQVDCQAVFPDTEQLALYLNEHPQDIAVWMLTFRPPESLRSTTRHGIWSLSNDESDVVGFWELVEAVPTTTCELYRLGSSPADDAVVGRAYAKTDRKSLTRTLRVVHALDESLLLAKLNEAYRLGDTVVRSRSQEQRNRKVKERPGALRLVLVLSKLYWRYLLTIAHALFYRDQWQLAYRVGGDRLSQAGLRRLSPEHSGFWADPFVVRRDDRTVIVFEELPHDKPEGRIAIIEILDDGSTGPVRVVLECDHHLSYPFLFEFENSLFMVPESADANRIEAFKCVEFPDRWEHHAVLLDGIRAFDSTLLEHEGRWWMFLTAQHNGNTTDDELHLFHAPHPFGEWAAHPENPISLDVRCARPAGALFMQDGQLYRPAQDCSVRYGYALSIQRVIRMDTEVYEEETVQHILPNWDDGIVGTHTINQAAGVTVYDCIARRRK